MPVRALPRHSCSGSSATGTPCSKSSMSTMATPSFNQASSLFVSTASSPLFRPPERGVVDAGQKSYKRGRCCRFTVHLFSFRPAGVLAQESSNALWFYLFGYGSI